MAKLSNRTNDVEENFIIPSDPEVIAELERGDSKDMPMVISSSDDADDDGAEQGDHLPPDSNDPNYDPDYDPDYDNGGDHAMESASSHTLESSGEEESSLESSLSMMSISQRSRAHSTSTINESNSRSQSHELPPLHHRRIKVQFPYVLTQEREARKSLGLDDEVDGETFYVPDVWKYEPEFPIRDRVFPAWRFGEIVEIQTVVPLETESPANNWNYPLKLEYKYTPCFFVVDHNNVTYLSTDEMGWRQLDVHVCPSPLSKEALSLYGRPSLRESVKFWGKTHRRWAHDASKDVDAERVCTNRIKTHLFVKDLLRLWQKDIARLKFNPESGVSEAFFYEQVDRALSLKVAMCMILREVGYRKGEPRWWGTIEGMGKGSREIHVRHDHFQGLLPDSVWHLAIASFGHWVNHHLEGKACICKIDCSDGLLMNLDFVDARIKNDKTYKAEVQLNWFHHHNQSCNVLCAALGLLPFPEE